tara:strand:+ start:81 stop:422 length:342 start_codon:yes stop_codon:yes gene_type:complete
VKKEKLKLNANFVKVLYQKAVNQDIKSQKNVYHKEPTLLSLLLDKSFETFALLLDFFKLNVGCVITTLLNFLSVASSVLVSKENWKQRKQDDFNLTFDLATQPPMPVIINIII